MDASREAPSFWLRRRSSWIRVVTTRRRPSGPLTLVTSIPTSRIKVAIAARSDWGV